MGGEDYVTICVKLDGDLARWLRRVSRSLPYSEEEVIIHLLRSFRDTWLLVESAVKNAGYGGKVENVDKIRRKLRWVKDHRGLVLEFMNWLGAGGKQLASAGLDDAKAFLSTRNIASNTYNVYLYTLKCAIDLAKSGVDLGKILNTGNRQ
jgi:hypothetical protein